MFIEVNDTQGHKRIVSLLHIRTVSGGSVETYITVANGDMIGAGRPHHHVLRRGA